MDLNVTTPTRARRERPKVVSLTDAAAEHHRDHPHERDSTCPALRARLGDEALVRSFSRQLRWVCAGQRAR